jgi:hypothetical protein
MSAIPPSTLCAKSSPRYRPAWLTVTSPSFYGVCILMESYRVTRERVRQVQPVASSPGIAHRTFLVAVR